MFYKCNIELNKLKGTSKNFPLEKTRDLYKSIKKSGLKHPLLIDKKYNICLGNTRLCVLKLLRKKATYLVPCIMYSDEIHEFPQIKNEKELCKKLNVKNIQQIYGFFK